MTSKKKKKDSEREKCQSCESLTGHLSGYCMACRKERGIKSRQVTSSNLAWTRGRKPSNVYKELPATP